MRRYRHSHTSIDLDQHGHNRNVPDYLPLTAKEVTAHMRDSPDDDTKLRWCLSESKRFLERWWFPTDLPSVRATALVQSPAAFRRRGVFITEADLSRC